MTKREYATQSRILAGKRMGSRDRGGGGGGGGDEAMAISFRSEIDKP